MTVRRILCATDLTGTSLPAIREAAELARELGAMLTILTVVPAGDSRRDATAALIAQIHDAVARGDCVPVHPVVRQGAAGEEILAEAAEERADLVVLGTHGRAGLDHIRLGSTAERVIQRSSCPVITVRARAPTMSFTHAA
jgi:nucleotide-binding universal stress UspA family protein